MVSHYTRTNYTPCDSFFVETDPQYSMAERARERDRVVAKLRQREFAAELSKITSDYYLEDILDHMERMEEQTMPDVASIDIQHEIKWYMRPFLLDFLIEAHMAFSLLPETLYLTVNILDRYCSRRVVYKRHYQLVACAALLIASKYGDKKDRVPTFRELRSICCSLYDELMFMQMEWHVLQTLEYTLGHPTVDSFLQIALAETTGQQEDPELLHLAWFMCENALYYRDFVAVQPSKLSRSALALARHILGRPEVSPNLWGARGDVDIMFKLHELCLEQPTQVISQKYSSQKLSSVAQIVESYMHNRRQEQMQQVQQQVSQEEMVLDVPNVPYVVPSTPQKMAYHAPVNQFGLDTPPITPENENAYCVDRAHQPGPSFPSTPSPVPSHHTYHHPGQYQLGQQDVYYGLPSVQ